MTIYTSQLDFWLEKLGDYLTERADDHRISRTNAIVERHDVLSISRGHHRMDGFIFEGLIYRATFRVVSWVKGTELLPLHEELHSEMLLVKADALDLTSDVRKVRQAALLALKSCTTDQDARDCLPDCVLPAFGDLLSKLPRTREPGFTVAESPVLKAKWDHAVERMLYHTTMRLMYS